MFFLIFTSILIELRFHVPLDTKYIGHFGDVLHRQSVGVVLKKLNCNVTKAKKEQNSLK